MDGQIGRNAIKSPFPFSPKETESWKYLIPSPLQLVIKVDFRLIALRAMLKQSTSNLMPIDFLIQLHLKQI